MFSEEEKKKYQDIFDTFIHNRGLHSSLQDRAKDLGYLDTVNQLEQSIAEGQEEARSSRETILKTLRGENI
jgi:predicted AlkP superfamily pyrophosphatase or phosphodiesterase